MRDADFLQPLSQHFQNDQNKSDLTNFFMQSMCNNK